MLCLPLLDLLGTPVLGWSLSHERTLGVPLLGEVLHLASVPLHLRALHRPVHHREKGVPVPLERLLLRLHGCRHRC